MLWRKTIACPQSCRKASLVLLMVGIGTSPLGIGCWLKIVASQAAARPARWLRALSRAPDCSLLLAQQRRRAVPCAVERLLGYLDKLATHGIAHALFFAHDVLAHADVLFDDRALLDHQLLFDDGDDRLVGVHRRLAVVLVRTDVLDHRFLVVDRDAETLL